MGDNAIGGSIGSNYQAHSSYGSDELKALQKIQSSDSIYKATLDIMADPSKRSAIALAEISDDVQEFTVLETSYNDLVAQLRSHTDGSVVKNPETFNELITKVKEGLQEEIKNLTKKIEEGTKFKNSLQEKINDPSITSEDKVKLQEALQKTNSDLAKSSEDKDKFISSLKTVNSIWSNIQDGKGVSREDAQGLANALLSAKEIIIPPGFNTESLGIKANQFREEYNLQLQRLKDAVRSVNPQN